MEEPRPDVVWAQPFDEWVLDDVSFSAKSEEEETRLAATAAAILTVGWSQGQPTH